MVKVNSAATVTKREFRPMRNEDVGSGIGDEARQFLIVLLERWQILASARPVTGKFEVSSSDVFVSTWFHHTGSVGSITLSFTPDLSPV
jgi:hypothetical protein